MKLVTNLCLLAAATIATTLQANPTVNISEFHNPKFLAPIHETSLTPQGELENHPRFRPAHFDVLHYDIDVDVDPVLGTIDGSLGIFVKALVPNLSEIDLDAINMQIEGAYDGQQLLTHRYDGTIVRVQLDRALNRDETIFVRIKYKALMPQTLRTATSDVTNPHRMQTAYTYTQPEGSSYWYPCLDRPADKATMTIKVTVPSGFNALSNGDLVTTKESGQTNEFSYRMEFPIATYLVSLAIGNYEVFDIGNFKNKPLTLWAPPSLREAALTETSRTKNMMEVFSEFTGVDYPFNSYATSVAQAYRSSMEHQAATTMGSWRITGDTSGEGVVAHELAHQWFGDWVTCRTWGELWLNEGYASYLPYVFFIANSDEVRALGQVDYWRDGYFSEAQTSVHPLSSANPNMDDIFDSHAYEKGALTIHFMRSIANRSLPQSPGGEEVYTKALRNYLTAKGGSAVTNYDLEKALNEVTGQNWSMFFDQFIRSEGHPVLTVKANKTTDKVSLEIEQTQFTRSDRKWRTFSFPLEVELLLVDGTTETHLIDIYDATQTFELQAAQEIIGVNLDPQLVVPAQITTDLDVSNWQNVFSHSKITASRLTAMRNLIALQGYIADPTFTALAANDPSEYIRAAAISELTSKTENRSAVSEIYRSLISRGPSNVATRGSVARAEEWLVNSLGRIPTRDEERSWQSRYLNSDVVAERSALLNMLSTASLERAQAFAIERLAESKWVMQDRWALVTMLSKKPTATAKPFIAEALKSSATLYQRLIMENLTSARYDDDAIATDVLNIAKSDPYFYTREVALNLLAKQQSSAAVLCPEIKLIATQPAVTPDMLAGTRAAANNALQELNCASN